MQRLRLLRDERVTVVLDVGANVGEYARSLRWTGYRGRIVSYEPMRAAFDALAKHAADDPRWVCRPVALGAEGATASLHVSADGVSSSLLPQLTPLTVAAPTARYQADESVTVSTLDDERDAWSAADRIFLKIDVQGYEAEVLRGARTVLGSVVGVEMELSLEPLYEGQASFHEGLADMRDLGFELVSMENVFVDPGAPRLLQVDGLFVRRR